jgi:thiol-disulfide isomerase/thioredoxin
MNLDPVALIAVYVTLAVVLRMAFPNRLTVVLFLVVFICSGTLIYRNHSVELANAWTKGKTLLVSYTGGKASTPWPPQLDQPYPLINMIDQEGKLTSLEEFRGKVVLVELIGMSCPACVALSGGDLYGGFGSTMPQPGIESIDEYVERYAGETVENPDIIFVQILLFDTNMEPTDADDAQTWAYHFRNTRERNRIVLAGSEALFGEASKAMVPGFHLLDRNLVMRADSSGLTPKQNLYEELIPKITELLGAPET